MQAQIMKQIVKVYDLSRREFGVFVPFLQKASDPIQQLFLDKLKEYRSKNADGKLITPAMQKQLKSDKERLLRQFNIDPNLQLTQFPNFKFVDPPIETPGLKKAEQTK